MELYTVQNLGQVVIYFINISLQIHYIDHERVYTPTLGRLSTVTTQVGSAPELTIKVMINNASVYIVIYYVTHQ